MDLALYNLQMLICHKTQATNQPIKCIRAEDKDFRKNQAAFQQFLRFFLFFESVRAKKILRQLSCS